MDRLIAEKVLERRWVSDGKGHEGWAIQDSKGTPAILGEKWNGTYIEVGTPDFSKGIFHAFTVVDHLVGGDHLYRFDLTMESYPHTSVTASFSIGGKTFSAQTRGNEEALAICRAALKALDKEKSGNRF